MAIKQTRHREEKNTQGRTRHREETARRPACLGNLNFAWSTPSTKMVNVPLWWSSLSSLRDHWIARSTYWLCRWSRYAFMSANFFSIERFPSFKARESWWQTSHRPNLSGSYCFVVNLQKESKRYFSPPTTNIAKPGFTLSQTQFAEVQVFTSELQDVAPPRLEDSQEGRVPGLQSRVGVPVPVADG